MTKIIALLFVPFALQAAPLAAPEQSALLQQLQALRKANPSMQADFSEKKKTHLLNEPILSSGTIAFSVPNKFRREQKGDSPSTTICNGKTMWIYYPNFREVEIYTLGQRAFFDDSIAALTAGLNFEAVEQFYSVQSSREGDGYRVILSPKKANLKKLIQQITVTLNGNLDPQQTEALLPKGDRLTTDYTRVRRTKLPDSHFEFSPPADAHISYPLGK